MLQKRCRISGHFWKMRCVPRARARKKGGLEVLLEDEVGKKRTRLLWEFNFPIAGNAKRLMVSDQPRICAPTISRPKWPSSGYWRFNRTAHVACEAVPPCAAQNEAEKRQMLHLPHQTTAPTYDSKHAVTKGEACHTKLLGRDELDRDECWTEISPKRQLC